MNREELEDELTFVEDRIQNLRLEMDVSHRPTETMKREMDNLVKMREAISAKISSIVDPETDYGKVYAFSAVVAIYAKESRCSLHIAERELLRGKPSFERMYDAGIKDPKSLLTLLRKEL